MKIINQILMVDSYFYEQKVKYVIDGNTTTQYFHVIVTMVYPARIYYTVANLEEEDARWRLSEDFSQ